LGGKAIWLLEQQRGHTKISFVRSFIGLPNFIFLSGDVTMKFKRLFQIVVLLTLVFSSFGSGAHVRASSNSPRAALDAIVINRNLNVWDATYIGFVSASIFEKWSLELTEAHNFVVTVSPITGDLVPLLTLQDANGNEIAHGTGTLTTI